jgi:NAD(P)-dependent dehydrogenase (short-subunit alcohol dehydrogenase family)
VRRWALVALHSANVNTSQVCGNASPHGSFGRPRPTAGFRPSANTVLQGAVNAALEALVRGVALELAPIRVNAVSPGLIETPLWAGIAEAEREAMFASAVERLPLRRIGQSSDVANAVLFLASTPFSTGSTVVVDGGGTISG